MSTFSYSRSRDKAKDPSRVYRMPAWNEALSQINKYMGEGLPEFQAPSEEELGELFSLSPTEQAAQESLFGLANQGFITPSQRMAGFTSLGSLTTTPEQAMLPGLTRSTRDYLYGFPEASTPQLGAIESTYNDLFSQPIGSSPYMQKLTQSAWGDLGTEGMQKGRTLSNLLESQAAYQDATQMAQMAPQVLSLQGAGASGLSGSVGAPSYLQSVQAAAPMFQMPYELDLAQRMAPLQWQQGQLEAENQLWNLAMQMMGTAPIEKKTESVSY